MRKTLSFNTLERKIHEAGNLELQEELALRVGERRLSKAQALEEEIKDLKHYISKFASEGATKKQIKEYELLLNYVDYLYNSQDYYGCALTTTTLKYFFDLDLTFFTLLPHLRQMANERESIKYDDILKRAKTINKEIRGNR